MAKCRHPDKKLEQSYIAIGNHIVNSILNNAYKNIGVFATSSDRSSNISWIKSLFHGCEIRDAVIEAALESKGKTLENIVDYDMAILINLKFNNDEFNATYEDKISDDIGIAGQVPIIQINYLFDTDKFYAEDSELVSDGISKAKEIQSIKKHNKPYWDLTQEEEKNLF